MKFTMIFYLAAIPALSGVQAGNRPRQKGPIPAGSAAAGGYPDTRHNQNVEGVQVPPTGRQPQDTYGQPPAVAPGGSVYGQLPPAKGGVRPLTGAPVTGGPKASALLASGPRAGPTAAGAPSTGAPAMRQNGLSPGDRVMIVKVVLGLLGAGATVSGLVAKTMMIAQ
jgi:hypothetical protein